MGSAVLNNIEKLSAFTIIFAFSVLSFSCSLDNSNKSQSECSLEVPDILENCINRADCVVGSDLLFDTG